MERICVQDCNDSMNSFPFQQYDFMIFMKRSFHAVSRRLVGFDNGSVFCLALLFNAAGLPVLLASSFARHCSWHRNTQLSTRVFHDILEFFTSWINEVNTTQFSSIVKPRFFDSPLLLFFALRRFRYIFPNLWPQSVWCGGRLLSCQSPSWTRLYPSNLVNLVKPVQESDNSRSPSTFQ